MKQMVLITLCSIFLVGCVVHPKHHHHARGPVKVVAILDKEHSNKAIVVVHKRPKATRNCWTHGNHWHCKR